MNRGGAEVNGAMLRIGFDIGGSKIAAIALDPRGREVARLRRDVPRDYPATLAALAEFSEALQHGRGPSARSESACRG
jgi:fructokinase